MLAKYTKIEYYIFEAKYLGIVDRLIGVKKVFNRDEPSWHELNPVAKEEAEVYKDNYSAKYLNRVYYPAFKLRVKEKNRPESKYAKVVFKKNIVHEYGRKWTF